MRPTRRVRLALAGAVAVLAGLPATTAHALAPRQLIPCAFAASPDYTFTAPRPSTPTLGFPGAIGQVVDGVAVFVAVFRNGQWQTRLTGCGTTDSFAFGTGVWPSTVPVAGDWDGDGISGIGTYTGSTGTWAVRATPTGGVSADATYLRRPRLLPGHRGLTSTIWWRGCS